MAQTIQIKRSSATATPTSLSAGELAYSDNSDKLFIGQPSNNTVVTIGGKAFTDKLDGIDAGANNYILPVATNSALGGIKIGYTDNGKNYAVELDADQEAYVNVPWTDTVYTLPTATSSTLGGVKIGSGISISNGVISADEVDSTAVSNAGALMKTGGEMSGNITMAGTETVDGRDLSVDGAKLDNIEANADVTDATNVAAAGALMKSGGTMTGNLKFGDAKSIFLGASDDFQIVHSTSGGSFIVDQGPGAFKLVTNGTGVQINGGGSTGGSATTVLAEFHSDSSASSGDKYYVELNHGVNSDQKFRTASGGIEVTGNIVVSGNVDGRDVATDGTKLDTIAENADVTPSWVPSSNPNYLTSETFADSDAGNFTFSGNTISTSGTIVTIDDDLTVTGDLIVQGTTTTVNSNTVELGDAILLLNSDQDQANAANTDDAGLEVKRGTDSSELNAFLVWDESADRWSVDPGTGTLSPLNVENVAIDGGTF